MQKRGQKWAGFSSWEAGRTGGPLNQLLDEVLFGLGLECNPKSPKSPPPFPCFLPTVDLVVGFPFFFGWL